MKCTEHLSLKSCILLDDTTKTNIVVKSFVFKYTAETFLLRLSGTSPIVLSYRERILKSHMNIVEGLWNHLVHRKGQMYLRNEDT